MEIILAAVTVLTIAVLVVLVGTKGKLLRMVSHFQTVAGTIRENRLQLLVLIVLVILTALFAYFFYLMPGAGAGPVQPIAFSHRVHAGHKKIDCRFCHPYADRSLHPGIPPVEKCLYCHKYIIANHPWIKKEHRYYNTDTPTPWRKVNYVPEHVFFNHKRHIKNEIACAKCHGAVEAMDRLDRNYFKMGFCIECHRREEATLGCWLACHN